MKVAARAVLVVFGLALLLLGSQMVASEAGEVVVLTTMDEQQTVATRVWVVEVDGTRYLRSGSDSAAWYQRLVKAPQVKVEREGVNEAYTAVPLVAARDQVNQLMREKYGWADRYIALLFGRDDAVPIRLDAPAVSPGLGWAGLGRAG